MRPQSQLTIESRFRESGSGEGQARRHGMRSLIMSVLLLTSGCSGVPADPDGTLDRVRGERTFRVGLIANGTGRSGKEAAFLRRVSDAADASPLLEIGATEALLSKLEDGEVDLVIGEFDSSTPWSTRVTFVPPLTKLAEEEHRSVVSAAAKNGENAWITLLHKQADIFGAAQ